MNHWMWRAGVELFTGGFGKPSLIACPLDHGRLHAEAEAKEGYALFAGPANRCNFPVHAPVAKAPRHHHSIHASQERVRTFGFDLFGTHPMQIEGGILGNAGVAKRLDNR